MNRRSRYVGFAITIVFVALLVWRIDLRELGTAFASANYVWVAPAFVCTVTSYVLRTRRWQRILRPIRPLSYRMLLPVLFIGFMANNLLPARLGEVVRAYALGRKTGLSKSLSLATILLERLFDGVTVVVVLGLVALLFPLPTWGRDAGYFAGGLFLAIAVAALLVLANEHMAFRVIASVLRPLPRHLGERARLKAQSFVAGLGVLRSGSDLLAIAAWSGLIWSIESVTYFVVIRSMHPTFQTGTPLLAALLLLVTVNLGTLIPAAPGYVGVFQAFGVLALSAFGVPQSIALAIAIVAHVVQWVTVTGFGLFFLARESMALGSLTGDAMKGTEGVPAAPGDGVLSVPLGEG